MGRSVWGRGPLTVALSILMLFGTVGAKPKHEQLAGTQQPGLSHKSADQIVWLTQRRLMKRVIHCVPPQLPTGGKLRLKSNVTAEIKIAADGEVEAARIIQGHPLLYQAVIDAVRKWTFKPMLVRGKAFRVVGRLRFFLSTLDGPTKKQGCLRGF